MGVANSVPQFTENKADFKEEQRKGLRAVKKRKGPDYVNRIEEGVLRRARHCCTLNDVKREIAEAQEKLIIMEFFSMLCDDCFLCKPDISEFWNQNDER